MRMPTDAKAMFCPIIPGIRNTRYFSGDPAIAPPKMKVKSRVNMIGDKVTPISPSGVRHVLTGKADAHSGGLTGAIG